MQSKISFCNRTIIKKDIMRFWPLWAIELLLLQYGNVSLYFSVQGVLRSKDLDEYRRMKQAQIEFFNALTMNTNVVFAAVFSVAAAILVFGYLSRKASCYAVHSMPLDRKTLFISHFMAGLSMLAVPWVLSYLVTGLFNLIFGLGLGANIFGMALEMLLILFFFYNMACVVVMLSGNGIMSALIYGVLNVLAAGISLMLSSLTGFVSYGAAANDIRNVIRGAAHFTPLYYFSMATDNGALRGIYERLSGRGFGAAGRISMEKISELKKFPWEALGKCSIYLLPAICFCLAAYFLYKRRPLENTGDAMPFSWSKVVFRIVFSAGGGFLLSFLFWGFIGEEAFMGKITYGTAFLLYLLFLAMGCMICYLVSEMILSKEFKVWKKVSLVQMAAVCIAVLLLAILSKQSYQKRGIVPAQDTKRMELSFCGVTYYYKEGEVPEDLEKLQRKITEEGSQELFGGYWSEEECGEFTITCITKDGKTVNRDYTFAGYRNEELLSEITEFFERQEGKEKKMFPESCSGENLFSYGTSLYVDGEEPRMTKEGLQAVLDGVIADIKEGNMKVADWKQYQKEQENGKMLQLSFDLEEEGIIVVQELYLNKKCTHTLQALEHVG